MARRGDNIHKRKDGRWEGRFKSGLRDDGSTKYSSVYASSYSECKRKLISAQIEIQSCKTKTHVGKPFSEVLSAWLLTNSVRIKGATKAKYIQMIDSHISPALGQLNINDIDSNTVNRFLNSKLKSGSLIQNKPLSSTYVRTMAVIIEATIKYAVSEGLCNPLKNPINKPSIPKNDITVLSKASETSLTEKLSGDTSLVSVGILLALQGGLRIGEVCALQWSNIDFENSVIHVRYTVSRVPCADCKRKTMLILDTPKTVSSVRDIPMPSSLRNALLRAYNNRRSEFVVSTTPSFVSTRTFDNQYRRLLKQYGVQTVNFHTLRHTYATRCAESGIDAKALSLLLGHSSSNTSLNIYVHPSFSTTQARLEQIFCSTL